MTHEQFRLLRGLVREHCGVFFRDDLERTFERRLAPRLEARGVRDFRAYCRLLRDRTARSAELDAAAELLAPHETYFYREPEQLRAFSEELLPLLARRNVCHRRIRVWSAGCSTGEEPYTIAILLKASGLFDGWNVEVVGSDIGGRALSAARKGVFGRRAFRTAEAEVLRPWFRSCGDRWVIDDTIRDLVSFARLNLLERGAMAEVGRMDVVFCRNVMIYFDLDARRRVARGFHEKLTDGGYLLLGHSESLLQVTGDFELVQLQHDLVYRKPAASGAHLCEDA